MIRGDFSLTLNPNLDSQNYLNLNNPRASLTMLDIIEEYGLTDLYRNINSNKKRYTWC